MAQPFRDHFFIVICVYKADIYVYTLSTDKPMTTVSVELDDKLAHELRQLSESLQTSEVDLIKKAVDNFLRQQRMDQIRVEIKPYAEAAGFLTEEDIYREIS